MNGTRKRTKVQRGVTVALLVAVVSAPAYSAESTRKPVRRHERRLPGWRTDVTRRSIELQELTPGALGKDGIPAIYRPWFVEPQTARHWPGPGESVISLTVGDESRAYPLQILMWHEITNDTVAGIPVAVTFCPLCYRADVFDRRIDGTVLTFGVSGFLLVSDMVMYDKQTESLWQQALGEAIVDELTGTTLQWLPAQIISFGQFHRAYPRGKALSHQTGYNRPHGRNPYVGYDTIGQSPIAMSRENSKGLLPRQQLVTVSLGGTDKAYPYDLTRELGAINDEVGGVPLVVFHAEGAVSALDRARIAASREVGSMGVFDRRLGERILSFRQEGGRFHDDQTNSTWDVTVRAVEGPLQGRRLTPIPHGDYFAFSWLVFKSGTEIFNWPSRGE